MRNWHKYLTVSIVTCQYPLDECGHVYKDLDEVLRVLETEGIARVANRLYPVANIKGTD